MFDPLLAIDRFPRQAELIALADDLAAGFAASASAHERDGSFPHENFTAIRAAGLHLLTVPGEFGGWNLGLPGAVTVLERLARGDGATALVFAMHVQVLGSAAASRAWPGEQFARICGEVVRDGAMINSAASEPELGSPSRGGLPATRARWDREGWILDGHKTFATGAPELTYFLVPAVLDAPDTAPDTVAVFAVRTRQPGVRIEETWDVMGMRSTGSHDLIFESACLPPDALILRRDPSSPDPGRVSGGAWFGLCVAAVYLGIATAARDAAIDFAHSRKPTALGGKSIASLEVIQQRLGALETELLPARALLYAITDAWERAPDARPALMPRVGQVKVVATTHAVAAVDLALRVVGGQSMTRALPLERLFRDVRAGLFHPPAEETSNTTIGKLLLGL